MEMKKCINNEYQPVENVMLYDKYDIEQDGEQAQTEFGGITKY